MARVILTLGLGCALAAASPSLRGQERRLCETGCMPLPDGAVVPTRRAGTGAQRLNQTTCKDSYGTEFSCGPDSACCGDTCLGGGSACCKSSMGSHFSCTGGSSCCGDTCMAAGGTCCKNELGDAFACESGDKCCGNTCVANQDKCCTDAHGTSYGVSGGSPCIDELKNCTNRHGKTYFCGKGSECCGDACTAPGAVCCAADPGMPVGFSCGQYSRCCGKLCVAPGSLCCVDNQGHSFPVAGTYVYPWQKETYKSCKQV